MNRIARVWTTMRLLTKVNLVVGTVLLLAFSYVAVTVYFGAASQVRYASNDFPGAKKAASAFLTLSPVQRHIGYYNRGTAEAAVGDFDPAQTDLESALEITPPAHECAVRINLSYVYEKQADQVADQDPDQSKELYDRSLKTLEDAPEECQPEKSEEQQKSDEARERVEDKKQGQQAKEDGTEEDDSEGDDSQDGDQSSEGSESDSDSGEDEQGEESGEDEKPDDSDEGKSESEKKRDELKERGENSEKNQQQQGPGGDGGRSTPEKPW